MDPFRIGGRGGEINKVKWGRDSLHAAVRLPGENAGQPRTVFLPSQPDPVLAMCRVPHPEERAYRWAALTTLESECSWGLLPGKRGERWHLRGVQWGRACEVEPPFVVVGTHTSETDPPLLCTSLMGMPWTICPILRG